MAAGARQGNDMAHLLSPENWQRCFDKVHLAEEDGVKLTSHQALGIIIGRKLFNGADNG